MIHIIGIDLGTTNSCVSVFHNGQVHVIANRHGSRTTPSVVAFVEGETIVGSTARHMIARHPKHTVYDTKRLIGRQFSDKIVQQDLKHWDFSVIASSDDKPQIQIDDTAHFPEEIAAHILRDLKETAENFLEHPVAGAVITVPAYFNNEQRETTIRAGELAGLKVFRVINEPTAAAMAYGLDKEDDRHILVYDLGGGTLDCSVLNLDNGIFQVVATSGDNHLGGEDFDNRVALNILKEFLRKNPHLDPTSIAKNTKLITRIRRACEEAKKQLSIVPMANIDLDALHEGMDFRYQLTRAKFDDWCAKEFERCIQPVEQVMKDSGLSRRAIHDVVLVGGSTRLPRIRDMLRDYFNQDVKTDINPDEAVSIGAALQGAILAGSDGMKSLVLVDVCPLSLGIETAGGIMTRLIPRNTSIPVTHTQTFSTWCDNQTSILVSVCEGEREFVRHNNRLGSFELCNLPPLPRGQLKVDVRFSVDVNGVLHVSACEQTTNKSKDIIIACDSERYDRQKLAHMFEEAAKFERRDTSKRDRIEALNAFDTYVHNVKNSMADEEMRVALGEDTCRNIMTLVGEAIQWLETHNDEPTGEYKDQQKMLEQKIAPLMTAVTKFMNYDTTTQ